MAYSAAAVGHICPACWLHEALPEFARQTRAFQRLDIITPASHLMVHVEED